MTLALAVACCSSSPFLKATTGSMRRPVLFLLLLTVACSRGWKRAASIMMLFCWWCWVCMQGRRRNQQPGAAQHTLGIRYQTYLPLPPRLCTHAALAAAPAAVLPGPGSCWPCSVACSVGPLAVLGAADFLPLHFVPPRLEISVSFYEMALPASHAAWQLASSAQRKHITHISCVAHLSDCWGLPASVQAFVSLGRESLPMCVWRRS